MNKRLIIIHILLCNIALTCAEQEAVCIVPVADLLGRQLGEQESDHQACYDTLIMDGPCESVKRIDQLMFNEQVTIVQTVGDECHIRVPGHYYCSRTDATLHNDYWTLTKNLATLDTLDDRTIVPDVSNNSSSKIICLREPFHDYKHYRLYSIGTRFVLDAEQDSTDYYRVRVFTKQLHTSHLYIPKSSCINTSLLNDNEKTQLFLQILNELACPESGGVPYVFGGCSFVKPYGHRRTLSASNGKTLVNASPVSHACHSGFDCSSLVMRIAQTAGLPWKLKNSSAMHNYLKPLAPAESVENGDLLFIPGHIMIIADKDKSLLIEARTKLHGYGCVHCIPFNHEFKGVNTLADLIECHLTQKPVVRLNASGEPIITTQLTILKLNSGSAPGRI